MEDFQDSVCPVGEQKASPSLGTQRLRLQVDSRLQVSDDLGV